MSRFIISIFITGLCLLIGCGGTYEYRVEKLAAVSYDKKFPDSISLSVSTESVYNHTLGFKTYKLYIEEGVKKYYEHALSQCFTGGLIPQPADINIAVTAMDTSIFPIAGLIIDIRLFFKVQILNKKMQKEKTAMIYGFGSDPDGSRALEKAVANSFYQLLPYLEELFVRQ